MANMKICKCGKLIPYIQKRCDTCESRQKECSSRSNKEYKEARQDKQIQAIYNSKVWKITVKVISNRDTLLCQLCLDQKKIKQYDTVHHIIEIKEDLSKAFLHENLICLCESCHQQVHKTYRQSKLSKQQMQQKLLKILALSPRGV